MEERNIRKEELEQRYRELMEWYEGFLESGGLRDYYPRRPYLVHEEDFKDFYTEWLKRKGLVEEEARALAENVLDIYSKAKKELMEGKEPDYNKLGQEFLRSSKDTLKKVSNVFIRELRKNQESFLAFFFPSFLITQEGGFFLMSKYFLEALKELKEFHRLPSRSLAKYFGLPYLEDLPYGKIYRLLERKGGLEVLAHEKTGELVELLKSLGRAPHRVLDELSKVHVRRHVLDGVGELPHSLYHEKPLGALKRLDSSRAIEVLEALRKIREHAERVEPSTLEGVIEILGEDPSLHEYLGHPLLLELAKLVSKIKREYPELLDRLKKLRRFLDKHTISSLGSLLRIALERRDPELLEVLLDHPDLEEYYDVIGEYRGRLKKEELRNILDKKQLWMGLSREHLRKALDTAVGRRVLMSEMSLSTKRSLLKGGELTEREVEIAMTAERLGLPLEVVRTIYNRLGTSAGRFLEENAQLLREIERDKMGLALGYYELVGRVDKEALEAMSLLRKAFFNLSRRRRRRPPTDEEIVRLSALLGELLPFIRRLHPLEIEELVRASRNPTEFKKMVEEVSKNPGEWLLEAIKRMLRDGISLYDGRNVRLNRRSQLFRLVKEVLGKREIISEEELRNLVRSYASRFSIENRAKKILDEVLDEKRKEERRGGRVKKQKTVGASGWDKTQLQDLGSMLKSMYIALKNGNLSVDIRDDSVIIRIIKKTHESLPPWSNKFRDYVRRLDLDIKKESKRVIVPLEFFKRLAKMKEFSSNPFISIVLSKASPRSKE